jgi:hypothetical protein
MGGRDSVGPDSVAPIPSKRQGVSSGKGDVRLTSSGEPSGTEGCQLTDGNQAKPVHTTEEMCAIIKALSKEDIDRLRLAAERMANTLGGIDARDLLHEAFLASTLGTRHCPKDVNPVTSLINAMRSNLWFQSKTVGGEKSFANVERNANDELGVCVQKHCPILRTKISSLDFLNIWHSPRP